MKNRISRLSRLKNIGKVSEQWLNSIDIYTKEDIEEFGPIVIYNLLKANGYNVSLVMVYALQGAIMDLHWKDIPKDLKEELKAELKNNQYDVF